MPRHSLRIAPPAPYSLDVGVHGHGWIGLSPHAWSDGRFRTTIDLRAIPGTRSRSVVDVAVRQTESSALSAQVHARRPLDRQSLAAVRGTLRRMLALDIELTAFWRRCARTRGMGWVARRGAGRMLRSATLFEDLLKLLMTTNCTWANTVTMVDRVVAALGRAGPAGARAFPTAQSCADRDEGFWRDTVRAGYRAPHCRVLAQGFASGTLSRELEDPELPTDELRRRLLDLPGFGPYAVGQALRLLGRFDDLALDSWVRSKAAQLHGLTDDRAIAERYSSFAAWAGLALWMDVTREWHEGGYPL